LWSEVAKDGELKIFFPDVKDGGRLPDRIYFFNVLNTLQPDFLPKLIKHANEARQSLADN
jgi:hypothetical protein